jgi:predicted MFS family arabinose efflux permease
MSRLEVRRRLSPAVGAFSSNARNANLRRAQLSFLGAWTAEWAFTVALGVLAFREGGATAVGLVTLLRMVPSAVVAPFASALADSRRRELILAWVSGVRGVATGIAALVVGLGGPSALVYLLAVVSTVAATLYRPAHSALLPSLCRTPQELAGANVVRGLLDSVATLVGPALAAVLLEVSGVPSVFAAAALLSLWSGYLVLRIRYETVAGEPAPRRRLRAEAVEGIRAVAAHRDLALLVGLGAAQTFTRGAVTVFTVVVAIELLGTGEPGVGTLTAAIGAGAVIGSLLASLLVGTRRLARWVGVGVALWGLPLTLVPVFPEQAVALVLLAVVGVGNALLDLGLFTLMARLSDDRVLARVFGLLESVVALSVGLGSVVASSAIALLGIEGALVAVGALCPVVVALAWRRLRRLDLAMDVRDRELALLRNVPMLQVLPLPAVEQLARRLRPVTVPAGATVFEQGDTGDRFYVVEQGAAEVVGDGRVVARLGPGDGFGEIALLRDVPRTATVRAVDELRLQVLGGRTFLLMVTCFPPSVRESQQVVGERLDRFSPGQADGDGDA